MKISLQRSTRTVRHRLLLLFALLVALFSLGSDCDESLPSYVEPQNVLHLDLYSTAPFPLRLRYDIDRIKMGIASFSFDLDLSNQFDETISGDVPVQIGKLKISWDDNPQVVTSIDITHENEKGTHFFDPPGPLTLDPQDTASFLLVWRDFQDNKGKNLWDYSRADDPTEDDLHIYQNSAPMKFTAEASMQPVAGGPIVYSEEFPIIITFYTFERK